MSSDYVKRLMEDQLTASTARAATAKSLFEGAAASADIVFDWLELNGDSPDAIIATTRVYDLTVFPALATVSLGVNQVPASQLAMSSGGPLLLLPDDDCDTGIGKRILIAWNGSREAARAVKDAWPLLAQADEIHIITVSNDETQTPDPRLVKYLQMHGCKEPRISLDRKIDGSTSKTLRRKIAATGADLVVMGLYGRSRIQELVLGGVSNNLLSDPPAPLLLSH